MKLKGDRKMRLNTIYNEDCLEGMKRIPDGSIDMILCDLPYGTTANKWDSVIPLGPLWEQYKRIIKDNGAIVLTSSQPFTTRLISSNYEHFKYSWVWEKSRFANQMLAKYQPLKIHEDVNVFSKETHVYNPQGLVEVNKQTRQGSRVTDNYGGGERSTTYTQTHTNYPRTILRYGSEGNTIHPTQKPVELFEYLIKTYTNKGETVLDNCMGSGTTAIACLNTDRQYIGFELDETYHKLSLERIENHAQQLSLI